MMKNQALYGSPYGPQYLPVSWKKQQAQRFSIDENGMPKLKIYDFGNGGSTDTLYGAAAIANSNDPKVRQLAGAFGLTGPMLEDAKLTEGDGGIGASLGTLLHNTAEDDKPTLIGRAYNSGPIAGAVLTGGAGWVLGKLADKLLGEGAVPSSTIGLLGGGLLGGIISHIRTKKDNYYDEIPKQASVMEKKSVAFQNPRNFILERLQGATDLTPIQKAQLAARIRTMDNSSADRLKGIVRAAAGFGVGALIAKFFGASFGGMMMAGVVGAVSRSLLGRMSGNSNGQTMAWRGSNFF